MYESEEQLYYWVQDEFRLLYDFTMSVGDTMELFGDPLDSDFNCEESVFFVLDSLGLVSLNQTDKSVQYGKIYNPFSEELFTATIIETIGLVNLESEEYERSGYLIPSVIFPCAFDVTDFSFCSYQGTNISYNPTGQNCEVLPSATLEWLEIPIDIWPNPFNNILNVTYPKGMVPKRIRVVSTTGQLLEIINAPSTELTFKNNYQGMIILLMEFEEGLVLRKLIKRAGL